VRTAVDSDRRLSDLSADELRAASEHLDHGEVAEVLAQRSWLESKESFGGTALERVREQLEAARAELQ
jgi:argininosuccinate lyase